MLVTRFTELVGCPVPIQLAGMGAAVTPQLVAAVSNAGGLGMIGTARPGGEKLQNIERLIDQVSALTDRPFGVNFLIAPEFIGDLDPRSVSLAAQRTRVVEFFWNWPDPRLVESVHSEGALVSWQVGSRDEALAADAVGVDLIVVQGSGAGGHVRGTVGVLALLDEVIGSVRAPVLAAGGIGSGRTFAAALAAGADGARMGTRFLAAEEADVHPRYRELLLAAGAADTVLGRCFRFGWDAPGRTLRSAVAGAQAHTGDFVGELQGLDGTRVPFHRFEPNVVASGTTGEIDAMSLWAGESVGAAIQVKPAGEIVREVTEHAERLLRRW